MIVKKARFMFEEAIGRTYYSKRTYVKIVNSKVDSVVRKETIGGRLFASQRKRVYFTNMDSLSTAGIEKSVRQANFAMEGIEPKPDYYGIARGRFRYKSCGFDKKLASISVKKATDIANSAIAGAVENGATNVAGMLVIRYEDNALSSTTGIAGSYESTLVKLSLRVFHSDFSFQDIRAARNLSGLKPARMGKDAAEMACSIIKTGRIRNGSYDIVYTPSPGGGLMSNVNDAACMGSAETGSFLTKKLGEEVADRGITIYDDGKNSDAVSSTPFDEEGYPTQRTTVIKRGVMHSYLHNWSTAQKYHTKSTGNAGLVFPDTNTMFFENRKRLKDVGELIRQVDKGVLVTNTWYTRFSNYLKGDFSTVPRDLAIYIEKGEPKFAIRQGSVGSMVGIRISDNMPRMLKNVEYSTRDSSQATSWDNEGSFYFMPSVLVKGVKLTTA